MLNIVCLLVTLVLPGDETVEDLFPRLLRLGKGGHGLGAESVDELFAFELGQGDIGRSLVTQEGRLRLEDVLGEFHAGEVGRQEHRHPLLQDEFLIGKLDGVDKLCQQLHIHLLNGIHQRVGQQHSSAHTPQVVLLGLPDKGCQRLASIGLFGGIFGNDPIEGGHAVGEERSLLLIIIFLCASERGHGIVEDFQRQLALALRHGVYAFHEQVEVGHPHTGGRCVLPLADIFVVVDD